MQAQCKPTGYKSTTYKLQQATKPLSSRTPGVRFALTNTVQEALERSSFHIPEFLVLRCKGREQLAQTERPRPPRLLPHMPRQLAGLQQQQLAVRWPHSRLLVHPAID